MSTVAGACKARTLDKEGSGPVTTEDLPWLPRGCCPTSSQLHTSRNTGLCPLWRQHTCGTESAGRLLWALHRFLCSEMFRKDTPNVHSCLQRLPADTSLPTFFSDLEVYPLCLANLPRVPISLVKKSQQLPHSASPLSQEGLLRARQRKDTFVSGGFLLLLQKCLKPLDQ